MESGLRVMHTGPLMGKRQEEKRTKCPNDSTTETLFTVTVCLLVPVIPGIP